jgi:hypothetical protein
MSAIDRFIIGDGTSYARLCLITDVLGKFVSYAPRAVGMVQLQRHTGRAPKELHRLCAMLCGAQLPQPDPSQRGSRRLACEASQVTLEDAFRCVLAERAARAKPKAAPQGDDEPEATSRREITLLLMQATMGINQSVYRHLRQFSLDRLKVTAASIRPAHMRARFTVGY